MKSLPRGPAGPGEVWPEASTDAPRPRKSSNKLFQGFRGLGKAQTSCFKVFDASERLKQVVSRFPRPRKGSNKLFQGFRGLGKAQTGCFKVSDASERLKQGVSRFPRPRKGQNTPLEISDASEGVSPAGLRILDRYPAKPLLRLGRMKRASSVRGCSDEASEGGSTTPEAAQISATPCRVGWRGGRASCSPDRHAGGRHRGRDRG